MSTEALHSLRDYLTGTLSPSNMLWLSMQLAEHAMQEELKPMTMEEINERIAQSERDIAEGRVYDFDDAMRAVEEELDREEQSLVMAEAV